jgi:hypothetical protein
MDANNYVTYEEFGRKFFEIAVTEERVADAFASIAGNDFEMGPIRQGPGKFAKISAKVKIMDPHVSRTMGNPIRFAIRIPLAIEMMIDLRLDKPRFHVDGEIALKATARAAEPLLLIIDVEKPRSSDITVDVTSTSLRAELLRIVADVDGEVRRFIAAHVSGEIDTPKSQRAQVIDVAEQVASSWGGV